MIFHSLLLVYQRLSHIRQLSPSTAQHSLRSGALEEEERVGLGTLRSVENGGEEVGGDDVGNTTDLADLEGEERW